MPLRHHGPVALQERLLIGRPGPPSPWPSPGSASKSSPHVMRSLSDGNAERVARGEKRGGAGKARTEKVCIVKIKKKGEEKGRSGRGKEQQDAGRGGEQKQASDPHSSDPLVKGGEPFPGTESRDLVRLCSTGCVSFAVPAVAVYFHVFILKLPAGFLVYIANVSFCASRCLNGSQKIVHCFRG